MKPATFRLLAMGFGLFIAGVIWLANTGGALTVLAPIYNFPNGDKVGHFLLMGILSLFLHLGFRAWRVPVLRMLNLCLLLAAIITLEECSQLLFRDRTFSLLDLSASYAGIFLFGELGYYLKRIHQGGTEQHGDSQRKP